MLKQWWPLKQMSIFQNQNRTKTKITSKSLFIPRTNQKSFSLSQQKVPQRAKPFLVSLLEHRGLVYRYFRQTTVATRLILDSLTHMLLISLLSKNIRVLQHCLQFNYHAALLLGLNKVALYFLEQQLIVLMCGRPSCAAVIHCLCAMSTCLSKERKNQEAKDCLFKALGLSILFKQRQLQINVLQQLGILHYYQCDISSAIKYHAKASAGDCHLAQVESRHLRTKAELLASQFKGYLQIRAILLSQLNLPAEKLFSQNFDQMDHRSIVEIVGFYAKGVEFYASFYGKLKELVERRPTTTGMARFKHSKQFTQDLKSKVLISHLSENKFNHFDEQISNQKKGKHMLSLRRVFSKLHQTLLTEFQ